MGAFAVFGIENDGLDLAAKLLLLFLVVVWLALIFWTFMDARRRIADPLLVGCATAASAFPYVGTVVYLIVRPPEYLEDMRERELEIAAAEARLATLHEAHCPYCGFDVEKDFLRCPSCMRRLKEPCGVCSKPLDPRWKICPYCEAEVGQAAPEPRRTRPRRTAAASGSQRQGAQRQSGQRQSAARTARQAEQSSDRAERAVTAERQRAERTERPARAARERPPSAG
jgi:hypothetical protein